jgi:hypothetical protein
MPNHFLTVGLCARDWQRLEAKGLKDFDLAPMNGVNFCSLLYPLPEDLLGIISTAVKCRYVHKTTGEVSKNCNGPPFDEISQWDQVPLTIDELAALEEKHGATDWYEWQSNNWGTKWGTYHTKAHELGGDGSPVLIEFQTAWGPPNAAMMRKIDDYICSEYCLSDIKWIGHNPSNGSTVVIQVAKQ